MTAPTPFWEQLISVRNGDVIALPDGLIGTKGAHEDGASWRISGPYGPHEFDGSHLSKADWFDRPSAEIFSISDENVQRVLVLFRSPHSDPME